MYLYFDKIARPRSSTLFPYTTLFRSAMGKGIRRAGSRDGARGGGRPGLRHDVRRQRQRRARGDARPEWRLRGHEQGRGRSEEHTSELQSLRHLVCRLLLEKKKTKYMI